MPESLGQRDPGAQAFVSNAVTVEHVKHTQLLVLTYAFFCSIRLLVFIVSLEGAHIKNRASFLLLFAGFQPVPV